MMLINNLFAQKKHKGKGLKSMVRESGLIG